MLGLSQLRQNRVYQEARVEGYKQGYREGFAEGFKQGFERGQLQAKLEMVPWLLELGISVGEIAQRLGLAVETIAQVAAEQTTTSDSK
jgi:predicted transposase/invertase (TIGR01784 family)